MGDRVPVLLDGRLRQVGPTQRVFSAPADGDVTTFVGVETVVSAHVLASSEGRVILQSNNVQLEAVGDVAEGRQVLLCLRPEDVTLCPDDGSPPSSARNRLQGRIQRLVSQGPLVRVVLDCGFPLAALITRASAQALGLAKGGVVTLEGHDPLIRGELGWTTIQIPGKDNPQVLKLSPLNLDPFLWRWIGDLTLPAQRGSEPMRIVVKEYERYRADPAQTWGDRVVYADVV